jgi:tetratricopeptide (TPR) repeat protein
MLKSPLPLLIATSLLLGACTTMQQRPAEEAAPAPHSSSLKERSDTFLYLAAQDAIHQGQYELAIQLLTTLVQKNPEADEPRMQLVELLLSVRRTKLAAGFLQPLLDKTPLAKGISDEQLHYHVLHARLLAADTRIDDAQDVLIRILQVKPELISARMLQVSLYAGQKRYDMAEAALQAGIRIDDSPTLRKAQAELFIRQQKYKQATRALNAMRRLSPDDETPVLMLGNLAIQRKDTAAAETLLRDFLATHPQALRSKNMLGRLLVQEGRTEEAIAIYHGLAHDTGDEPDIISALGLLYFQNKQYDKAADQFNKVLRDNPEDGGTRYYLGACLEAMEQPEKARAQYLQIGDKDPAWGDAQLRLAALDFSDRKFAMAEQRALAVLKQQPKMANGYMILSAIYLAQEKYRELLDSTDAAMGLPHLSGRLLLNRAVAQEHFKQYEAVERTLNRLLAQNPNDAEALNFLGYTYAEQGIKLDKAEQLIRRALSLKPNDGYHLDSLAWVYYQRGNYAKAVDIQTEALKSVPNDPIMHEHMGDMLWKLGHPRLARAHWEKVIQLGHKNPGALRDKISKGL